MSSLGLLISFVLFGGVLSLGLSFLLFANDKRANKIAEYATPFAAGALLAAAFIDVLPEAAHEGNIDLALFSAMMGILGFFLLERYVRVFHHHHNPKHRESNPTILLVIIGDTAHNLIDGVAIAAAFLVSPQVGIVTTMAVAAHEIPQEIGDFGLLLHKGMSRAKVLLVNIISALATLVSAVLVFQLGRQGDMPLDVMLGVVGGFFIYIAASDIIPSIHAHSHKENAGLQTAMLFLGVAVVSTATLLLHGLIETV